MALNQNTATLALGDDFDLPFELLKQILDNSTQTVRARKIRNIVKKMQSLDYDGKFIHEFISRLKGIPVISKKNDLTLSDYDPNDDSDNQDSNNQDFNNQGSDNQDSNNQDANNQEDSRPVPIKSLKFSGFPDITIKKL